LRTSGTILSESLWEESEISVLLEAVLSSDRWHSLTKQRVNRWTRWYLLEAALEVELSLVLIVLLDLATSRSGV